METTKPSREDSTQQDQGETLSAGGDETQKENELLRKEIQMLHHSLGEMEQDQYKGETTDKFLPPLKEDLTNLHAPPILYKEYKITQLTQLSKTTIERFLQEIRVALRRNQEVIVEKYIFGEARTILTSRVEMDDDNAIINYLKEYLSNVTAFARNQPILQFDEQLKWPDDNALTLEKKWKFISISWMQKLWRWEMR